VLATPGLPPVALIGGLAVTARVSAAGALHRATNDIDLVTIYLEPDPEAVELIASAQGAEARPLLVNGVEVDIIPTNPVDDADLDGHEDHHRLFLAGQPVPDPPLPAPRLGAVFGVQCPVATERWTITALARTLARVTTGAGASWPSVSLGAR